jgi:2-dehydropantoate 2-reductase
MLTAPVPPIGRRSCIEGGTAMQTLILGAGALGSVMSAYLTRAWVSVTLLARGQRAAFLHKHGVAITGVEDFTVPVTVATHPHELREADLLIVTVKTYDTEPALASVSHLKIGSVFSLQNGVLKNEQLAHYFGWEKTLGASPLFSAEVTPTGSVHFTYHGGLVLGEFSGPTSPRLQTVAAMLEYGGMRPVLTPQIQSVAGHGDHLHPGNAEEGGAGGPLWPPPRCSPRSAAQ